MNLERGEIFGSLKVLERVRSGRFRVGCVCGYSRDKYTANALMRAGGHTKCSKCRQKPACKDSVVQLKEKA